MKIKIQWPDHSRFMITKDHDDKDPTDGSQKRWIQLDDAESAVLCIITEANILSRAMRDLIQTPTDENKKAAEKALRDYRKVVGIGVKV